MTRFVVTVVAIVFSIGISAQNKPEESAIKKVISKFFNGLHKGDSSIVKSTLHKDIKIQTTYTNKKGEQLLRTQTKLDLLKGIASKKASDVYLEKLLSYTIKIDGNLASVWTPYEFYLNDNFSHCGANSFQLFNNNGSWQIIYLVDMRRRGNCNALNNKK